MGVQSQQKCVEMDRVDESIAFRAPISAGNGFWKADDG